jgi:hypothetical protein
MPILNKGTDFATNDQVTSAKLDNLVDAADFTNTSGTAIDSSGTTGTCVSDGGLEVTDPGGQLQIKSNGVTTSKILDANVTKAKIENVANMKALGNTSGSATAPQEVSILDEDNMSSNSATALATQQSIKAYVDTNSGSGGYNLYRTVDARGGGTSAKIQNWSSNLNGTTSLGAFGTGSSGTDKPNIFTFSSTGTYLIELNIGIYDNDSDSQDHFGVQLVKTTDGTAQTQLTSTTNTGGTGGQKDMLFEPGYDQTHSLGKDLFVQMSFIYIVGNTSTDNLVIQVKARSAANLSEWEGSGILKITQI